MHLENDEYPGSERNTQRRAGRVDPQAFQVASDSMMSHIESNVPRRAPREKNLILDHLKVRLALRHAFIPATRSLLYGPMNPTSDTGLWALLKRLTMHSGQTIMWKQQQYLA
jgi:hypothetical protein